MKKDLENLKEYSKKPKKRGQAGFLLTVVFIILIFIFALYSPIFNIKSIQVIGQQKISAKKIEQLSGIYYGQNIFKINPFKSEENIRNGEPYIENITLHRKLPNGIILEAKERKPIGAVSYLGSYILIDKYGTALEIVTDINGRNVIEIKGITIKRFTIGRLISEGETEKLKAAINILDFLEKSSIIQKVEYIDVKDIKNISMFLDNRFNVKIGSSEDLTSTAVFKFRLDYLKCVLERVPKDKAGEVDLTREPPIFSPLSQ